MRRKHHIHREELMDPDLLSMIMFISVLVMAVVVAFVFIGSLR